MQLPGRLTIGFLQEDNPLKYYFRVRPLFVQEGDRFINAANVQEEFKDDGFIRIVPDKNEIAQFKNRMRQLGSYCLLDLRKHPNENDKIRPNKNHSGETGDRNAFIVYSDVVHATGEQLMAEVYEAQGAWDQTVLPRRPGTRYVGLATQDRLIGLFRWEEIGEACRPVAEGMVPVEQRLDALADKLLEADTDEEITRRLLVGLSAFGVTPEQANAPEEQALEPAPVPKPQESEETRPAPQPQEEAQSAPAAQPEEPRQEERPWLERAALTVRARLEREGGEQSGFNPRRGPSIKDILDDMWRQSRVDQLGHPVPGEAHSEPAVNPVEEAAKALSEAWKIPEARVNLVREVLSLQDMREALGLGDEPDAAQARGIRRAEEKLRDLEAERLRLVVELDKLKKGTEDTRAAMLEQLRAGREKEFTEAKHEIERLTREKDEAEQAAQRARDAQELATQSVQHVMTDQLEERLCALLAQGKARDMLLASVYGGRQEARQIKLAELTAGELLADLRVRFEQAGIPLTHDDAVNLLVCLAQGRILLLSGPCGSGKSLCARALGAALGLRENGLFYEIQAQNDWTSLGALISVPSATGVPLVRLPGLRNLLTCKEENAPCLLMIDDANRAPVEQYAGELLTLGEEGAPNALHTGAEELPLPSALRVVMTVSEEPAAHALTEGLLSRAWMIRLELPDEESPWGAPAGKLPAVDTAVSLRALQTLFAPGAEVPGEVAERMESLRRKLADRGVRLSRRVLSDTHDYVSAALPHMQCEPMELLDRALAQRVMPVLLASADLTVLRDVGELFADMPRCLALLNTRIPVPAF